MKYNSKRLALTFLSFVLMTPPTLAAVHIPAPEFTLEAAQNLYHHPHRFDANGYGWDVLGMHSTGDINEATSVQIALDPYGMGYYEIDFKRDQSSLGILHIIPKDVLSVNAPDLSRDDVITLSQNAPITKNGRPWEKKSLSSNAVSDVQIITLQGTSPYATLAFNGSPKDPGWDVESSYDLKDAHNNWLASLTIKLANH